MATRAFRIAVVLGLALGGFRSDARGETEDRHRSATATATTDDDAGQADPAAGLAMFDADDDPGLWDSLDFGAMLGVQTHAERSALGTPSDTSIANGVVLGVRASQRRSERLSFEAELPLSLTSTREGDATTVVLSPRLLARFDAPQPADGVVPFGTVGAGIPLVLTTDAGVLGPGVSAAAFLGGGVAFEPRQGLHLRFDTRFQIVPARGDDTIAAEIGFLLSLSRGTPTARPAYDPEDADEVLVDADGDNLVGDEDRCPDRPEDVDGFEDGDGCPDIDNDFDGELDIADQCPMVAETHNGYLDLDGCPDELPAAVAELPRLGAEVRFDDDSPRLTSDGRAALRKIARILREYPSVRILLVARATGDGSIEDTVLLSERRATLARRYLLRRGVRPYRVEAFGVGAELGPSGDADREIDLAIQHRSRE